jgi:acetolactate synthase regulatory subunit
MPLLLRALNLIAQRGMTPDLVAATSRKGSMRIVICVDEQPGMEALEERLRSLVEADSVRVDRRGRGGGGELARTES